MRTESQLPLGKNPEPHDAFITLLPTETPLKWLVVVMRPVGPASEGEYHSARTSQRLHRAAAEALAKSWAAAKGIKVVL